MTRWLVYPLAPIVILGLVFVAVILWCIWQVRDGGDEHLPYTKGPRACGLRGKGIRLR